MKTYSKFGIKYRRMKNGTLVFATEEGISVVFEEGKYDYDMIESVLNLYRNVRNDYLFTRSIKARVNTTMKILKTMLKNLPEKSPVFTDGFWKGIEKFKADLEQARMLLVS